MTIHPQSQSFRALDAAEGRVPDVGGAAGQRAPISQGKDVLRFITCGSVDDGKSTLIGRLLHDTKHVFDDQIASLRQQSRRYGTQGTKLDLALLVDGLQAEREQGITIDVAYRFFATDRRVFIVADTPGHEQYTRNMATGASTAQAAVLLVDARHGLTEQTRRHALLVSMLGITQVALAINKMDLVGWSQARFDAVTADFNDFAEDLPFRRVRAIPLSALSGANVVERTNDAAWYDGPTLLSFLENAPADDGTERASFAMPVQWVNRPHSEFRGFSGLIASGVVAVGDAVRVQPAGTRSTVARILGVRGDQSIAQEGESVTLVLGDAVDASRGTVIVADDATVQRGDRLRARLFWAADTALAPGDGFWLKIGTATVSATVDAIDGRIDPANGTRVAADGLRPNDIGDVVLDLDREVAFEAYAANRQLGSFILISRDTMDTAALGLVAG